MKIHANATKGSRTERARVNGTEKKIRRKEIFLSLKNVLLWLRCLETVQNYLFFKRDDCFFRVFVDILSFCIFIHVSTHICIPALFAFVGAFAAVM